MFAPTRENKWLSGYDLKTGLEFVCFRQSWIQNVRIYPNHMTKSEQVKVWFSNAHYSNVYKFFAGNDKAVVDKNSSLQGGDLDVLQL